MEGVLWYLLASSRGGPTRVRILRAIDERPRNANQLATGQGVNDVWWVLHPDGSAVRSSGSTESGTLTPTETDSRY